VLKRLIWSAEACFSFGIGFASRNHRFTSLLANAPERISRARSKLRDGSESSPDHKAEASFSTPNADHAGDRGSDLLIAPAPIRRLPLLQWGM